MTVDRLEAEMPWEEFLTWGEFYRLENDQRKRAQKEARDKSRAGRKGGRGRR